MRVTFFIYSYFLYFFFCHVLTTIFSSRLLFSSKTGECGDFFYLLLLAYLYSTKEFVEWLLIFAPIIIIVVCNHTRMAKNEDTTAILFLVNFGLKKIILLSLDRTGLTTGPINFLHFPSNFSIFVYLFFKME